FIRVLGGGCTSPSAAHAQVRGNELKLTGLYWNERTGQYQTGILCADVSRAQQAGEELAGKLMREMQ
ncbi:MAG TPA: hydroxymethylbilane synthase, partial [Candidatus Mediterraneibacter intestinavium]|nr:hydroxymethylbilane synthase [Candidatus Mediterraneibacter intestinavium]